MIHPNVFCRMINSILIFDLSSVTSGTRQDIANKYTILLFEHDSFCYEHNEGSTYTNRGETKVSKSHWFLAQHVLHYLEKCHMQNLNFDIIFVKAKEVDCTSLLVLFVTSHPQVSPCQIKERTNSKMA